MQSVTMSPHPLPLSLFWKGVEISVYMHVGALNGFAMLPTY